MSSTAAFSIAGMSCGHCLNRVNTALLQVEGVFDQQVEIGSAQVHFDPSRTSVEQLQRVITNTGYPASPKK